MADPLSILGAAAAALQFAQFICSVGTRLFQKPKDNKTLQALCKDCKSCIDLLNQWNNSGSLDPDAGIACTQLRLVLLDIVQELESLKGKKKFAKLVTALAIYSPDFQTKLKAAFEFFQFQMCVQSNKQSSAVKAKLDEMTQSLDSLKLSASALKAAGVAGTDEIQANLASKVESLSESMDGIQQGVELVRGLMKSISATVSQFPKILEEIKAEGKENRDAVTEAKVEVLERLDWNESVCRIHSELISDPEAVTWYDEVAQEEEEEAQQRPRLPPSKFRLWSLDVSPTEAMESQPSGQFQGLEVSAQPAPHPIDDILDKSHRAFQFDQFFALPGILEHGR